MTIENLNQEKCDCCNYSAKELKFYPISYWSGEIHTGWKHKTGFNLCTLCANSDMSSWFAYHNDNRDSVIKAINFAANAILEKLDELTK